MPVIQNPQHNPTQNQKTPSVKSAQDRRTVAAHLTLEVRENSILLAGNYPWSPSNAMIGPRTEYIEIPLGDIPALIMTLVRVFQEQGGDDGRGIGNIFSAHAR